MGDDIAEVVARETYRYHRRNDTDPMPWEALSQTERDNRRAAANAALATLRAAGYTILPPAT